MKTGIVFNFLPPLVGALRHDADGLRYIDNPQSTIVCFNELHVVRANRVRIPVISANNGAVVDTRHTTLEGFLADEAVISVLSRIADTQNAAIKGRIAFGQGTNP